MTKDLIKDSSGSNVKLKLLSGYWIQFSTSIGRTQFLLALSGYQLFPQSQYTAKVVYNCKITNLCLSFHQSAI